MKVVGIEVPEDLLADIELMLSQIDGDFFCTKKGDKFYLFGNVPEEQHHFFLAMRLFHTELVPELVNYGTYLIRQKQKALSAETDRKARLRLVKKDP